MKPLATPSPEGARGLGRGPGMGTGEGNGTAPHFTLVHDWLKLPPEIELYRVCAVAADSKGRIYLGHRGENPILLFGPEGEFIRSQGDSDIPRRRGIVYKPGKGQKSVLDFHLGRPQAGGSGQVRAGCPVVLDETLRYVHHLYVDAEDNLWVTDCGQSVVHKYSPGGHLLLTLGTADSPGSQAGQFNQPTDAAVNRDGEIFISDGYINTRIVKYAPDGKFLTCWGARGTTEGIFDTPHAIALDSDEILYVSDRGNKRIQLFDCNGTFIEAWTDLGLDEPGSGELNDIAWGQDGLLYGTLGSGNKIIALDRQGKLVMNWGNAPTNLADIFQKRATAPGEFNNIHAISVDEAGSLYVADVCGGRLQKFARAVS